VCTVCGERSSSQDCRDANKGQQGGVGQTCDQVLGCGCRVPGQHAELHMRSCVFGACPVCLCVHTCVRMHVCLCMSWGLPHFVLRCNDFCDQDRWSEPLITVRTVWQCRISKKRRGQAGFPGAHMCSHEPKKIGKNDVDSLPE
jgi:hypothetical protein